MYASIAPGSTIPPATQLHSRVCKCVCQVLAFSFAWPLRGTAQSQRTTHVHAGARAPATLTRCASMHSASLSTLALSRCRAAPCVRARAASAGSLRVRLCSTHMGKTGQHRGEDIRTARSPRGRHTTRPRTDCRGICTAAQRSSGHDSPSRRSAAHAGGNLPTTVPMRSRLPSGLPVNAPRTITAAPIAGAHLCARRPQKQESKLMQGCRAPGRWMGAREWGSTGV